MLITILLIGTTIFVCSLFTASFTLFSTVLFSTTSVFIYVSIPTIWFPAYDVLAFTALNFAPSIPKLTAFLLFLAFKIISNVSVPTPPISAYIHAILPSFSATFNPVVLLLTSSNIVLS